MRAARYLRLGTWSKKEHFLLGEHDRKLVRTAGAGKVLVGPGHFEGGEIEKP
jgi:hypothetical protein